MGQRRSLGGALPYLWERQEGYRRIGSTTFGDDRLGSIGGKLGDF
jgi:hypothetical protein